MNKRRTQVFISYSHQDRKWLDRLQVHLKPLERGGLDRWDDTRIAAGQDWRAEIEQALAAANVAVLLVRADFLASDFIHEHELPALLAAAETRGLRVLPVIVGHSLFSDSPLARFKAFNPPDKPLEGHSKAKWSEILVDVARAVREAGGSDDARAPLKQLWHVPHACNPLFTGREAILDQLGRRLAVGAVAISQPLAISGLGGIGKTQAALEYACRHRRAYRAVLWVSADSPEPLMAGFAGLARVLNLPEQDAREQELAVAAGKRWLAAHDGWLLVLDNLDDPGLVREILPGLDCGHVLITSRARLWGHRGGTAGGHDDPGGRRITIAASRRHGRS